MNLLIEEFTAYLREKRLAESTIKHYLQNLQYITQWSEQKQKPIAELTYNDLLDFISDEQRGGRNNVWINNELCSLRHYYRHLIRDGRIKINPANDLFLKGSIKKVLKDILTAEQLEILYQNYINKPEWKIRGEKQKQIHQRNTVILGLLVYQGLQTMELGKLEASHINLSQGTIYIPSMRRSNSRHLKLESVQMIPMQRYLYGERTCAERSRSSRTMATVIGEKLFSGNIHAIMNWLMKELKKSNTLVKSAQQIRVGVIVNWLKQHNLRQVQYMAGHRHIGSTERYKQDDLQDLQRQLELFHPMS